MNVKSVILFILICIAIYSSIAIINYIVYESHDEREIFFIGDGTTMKVGIISDFQLGTNALNPEDWNYPSTLHLIQSLKVLKMQKVQMIIIAGDITDDGANESYKAVNQIINSVYPEYKPELIYVMGNHDYWSAPYINKVLQKRFEDNLGQKPFSHKIINGYHFIGWGSENGSMDKSNTDTKWVKKELEYAVKDSKTKPIFVTTHFPPANTMYGSDEWGSQEVFDVLKDYPQVICFSGHSHYSLIDDRSIWQGEFTAINTQAIAYIELESGKLNGSVPKDETGNELYARNNYMGLIMNVLDDKVEIQRISFEENKFYKDPWVIPYPVPINLNRYTLGMLYKNAKKAVFDKDIDIQIEDGINIKKETVKIISFKQAYHGNFVHSYKIVLTKNKQNYILHYFSDFFLMKEKRKERIRLQLPPSLDAGTYDIAIYALDSYDTPSDPYKSTIEII